MSLLFSKLIYLRRRERKSFFFVLGVIVSISGFNQLLDAILIPQWTSGQKPNIPVEIKFDSVSVRDLLPLDSLELDSFPKDSSKQLNEEFENDISDLPDSRKKVDSSPQIKKNIPIDELTLQDLLEMDIPTFPTNNLFKYLNSGGKIHDVDDLLKIYGMDTIHARKISDQIHFHNLQSAKTEEVIPEVILLNQSTAKDLQIIRGIGPAISSRIIKFREKLGGFYAIEQLSEVYGLEDSIVIANRDKFIINNSPTKININTAEINDLASHPYCNYTLAKLIVNYRLQHGSFSNIEELNKLKLVNKEWLDRMRNYLTVL